MRREALNFLMCPNCAGELALSENASSDTKDAHIITGGLTCKGCGSKFSIRNVSPANPARPSRSRSRMKETVSRVRVSGFA